MKLEIYNSVNDAAAVRELVSAYRKNNRKIVFTNGCFDILHVGHLRYLKKAREMGDVLIIGLNSDSSVKKIKGSSRPFIHDMERAELLLGFSYVDHVIVFDSETPEELIKLVCPHFLVKGGDWAVKDIVGGDFVQRNGGRVTAIEFEEGLSTTGIIERILKSG